MGYEVEFHEKSLIFHFGEGIVYGISKIAQNVIFFANLVHFR